MLRRVIPVFLIILLVLAGCGHSEPEATLPPTVPETSIPATEAPTEPPTQPSTEPPHSELYIPGVSAQDVITYFNEVCLSAEFINSGDPSFLQRWEAPITYNIYGDYTPEDLAKVSKFTDWLNAVEGFPGISQVAPEGYPNLRIHFCDQQKMIDLMGEQYSDMDGAVTFWYDDNDVIFDAIICIRSDIDQYTRNSVILEEIYNGLGPIQDTALRPDSIIYSEFSEPQELTEMDELILKFLYHPSLSCGMDSAECEAAIRALYY